MNRTEAIVKVAKAFSSVNRHDQMVFLKSGGFTRDECYDALGELAKEEALRSSITVAKAHAKLSHESEDYKRVYDMSTCLPPAGENI
jgi:hypothetical protein